jgi:hypothetical protein
VCRARDNIGAAERSPPRAAAATTERSLSPQRGSAAASAAGAAGASPTKMTRRLAAEPPILKTDLEKRDKRRGAGRESDSESDIEAPEQKPTGLWFHRNVEFYSNDREASVEDYKKTIFEYVDLNNEKGIAKLKEIADSGFVDIDKVKRDGMTPLMWAVSRQRTNSVKALIELGADVTIRREADGSPLLFMAIEDEVLLQHLIEGGIDMKTKYEGHILEDHPLTAPHIAKIVKEMRRAGKLN